MVCLSWVGLLFWYMCLVLSFGVLGLVVWVDLVSGVVCLDLKFDCFGFAWGVGF